MLVCRSASDPTTLARIGGRRLGPYDVLRHRQGKSDYLLLRGATGEAAAALPSPPDIAVCEPSSSPSSDEEEEAPKPTADQLALFPGLPAGVAAALSALWPPGPADATPEERAALLEEALPADTMSPQPGAGAWGRAPTAPEVGAICSAVRLLRVRLLVRWRPLPRLCAPAPASAPTHPRPPIPPLGCLSPLDPTAARRRRPKSGCRAAHWRRRCCPAPAPKAPPTRCRASAAAGSDRTTFCAADCTAGST